MIIADLQNLYLFLFEIKILVFLSELKISLQNKLIYNIVNINMIYLIFIYKIIY